MRKGWLALIALFMPAVAYAQVQQSGTITSLHVPAWATDGVIQDGGSAAGSSVFGSGYITELGITNTGTPFCITSALLSAQAGYYQTCIGARATIAGNTGSFITFNAYGGATQQSLYFNINGTNYEFPGNGQGNILGPVSSTLNEPMVWANASGTLAKDGLNAPISHTGSFAVIGNTTFTGTLDVTGATTLGDTLDVTGATNLGGLLTVDNQITQTGTGSYLIDGRSLTVATGGIVMPRAQASGACLDSRSTIIDYGTANGNPAGGSFTSWDCSLAGGTFVWTNAGLAIASLSPNGMVVGPSASGDGYYATMPSGTGNIAFGNSGSWVHGLNLSAATITTAAAVLSNSEAGSTILSPSGYVELGTTTPVHLAFKQSTAPALTSCGTSPDNTGATDAAGTVTMGTGTPTGCVITFNAAYTAAPHCVVTWLDTPLASQSYTVSTTAITLTQTATDSNKVSYVCVGQAGG